MNSPTFNFVVALPAEAKPLTAHFGLKRVQPDGDFPIYQKGAVTLVRSGVGKEAAANATWFLLNHHQQENSIWINLGIAGHATRQIGDMILAKSILNEDSGEQWPAPSCLNPPCAIELLTTLNQPDFDYSRPYAFDMEAAGFLSALGGNGYCLKIISDNSSNPGHGIKAKRISQLIREQLDNIDQIMFQLGRQDQSI